MRIISYSILALIIVLGTLCTSPRQDDGTTQADTTDNGTKEQKSEPDTSQDNGTEVDASDFDLLVKRFEDPNRGSWQNPDLVIDKLGNLSGKVIADIGAGTGYFTFRLAPLAEKVISIDIDQRSLQFIEDKKAELSVEQSEKIETRLTLQDDPLLTSGEADIVLIVNTYHFIEGRVAYLKKVREGLSQDGLLVLVDFKSAEVPVVAPEELMVAMGDAASELESAGFSNIVIDATSLEYQYIITAQK